MAEATKVLGTVQSQSPSPSPSARQATWSEEVAEFDATAWTAPVAAATAASNRGTAGPWVRKSERSTAVTASMSSWSMSCRP